MDAPGFLVNRILLAYINEAGRVLDEGGTIEAIDRYTTRFGMPMGPFTLSDEVGLDVGVKVLHVLEAGLGSRFKPVKVFDEVLTKKLLGKKTGKGFYIHGKERVVNPEVQELIKPGKAVNEEDALKRMMYIMINEAAMILQTLDAKAAVKSQLRDPDSAEFQSVVGHDVGRGQFVFCGTVNAKNGFGGYNGFRAFFTLGPNLAMIEDGSKSLNGA